MGLLPDLSISPYVRGYVGNANQEFGNLLDKKITDYDVAKSQDDVLGLQTDLLLDGVGPFEGDRKYALQLQDYYRKRTEDRSSKGDYENMVLETGRDARDFMKRISPLQENYKRYSDFIQTLNKRDDIGTITKQAVKNKSLKDYKGIDPNNVTSTYFTGYNAPKDIQIGKEVDDLVKGIADTEWGRYSIDPNTGHIITESGKIITPEKIEALVESGLNSRQDIIDFKRSQGELGLEDLYNSEKVNAINQSKLKYAKNDYKQDISFVPQWKRDETLTLNAFNNLASVPNTPVINPRAINQLKNLDFDKNTGQVGINQNDFYKKDGDRYIKYVDKDGNPVPLSKVNDYNIASALQSAGTRGFSPLKQIYTPQEVSIDEVKNGNLTNNIVFDQIVTDASKLYEQEKAIAARRGLTLPDKDFKSNAVREEVYNSYKKSIENLGVILGNKRLSLGVESKFRANGLDQRVIEDLSGRKVYVKSPDKDFSGIIETDEGVDYNALVSQLYEEGWEVVDVKSGGLDVLNPYGDTPSVDGELTLRSIEDKGKTKKLKIGAETTPTESQAVQPLQDVMNLYSRGTSGTVSSPNGSPMFKVIVAPNLRNSKMEGYVIPVDEEGNDQPPVSIDTFDNYYINELRKRDDELRADGYPSVLEQLFGSVKTSRFTD